MYSHLYEKLKRIEKEMADNIEKNTGIGKHESLRDSIEELSLYDNHPADLGSESFERAKDLSLHENRLLELKKVRKALHKMEKGDYGLCEACGQAMDSSRLEILPYAEICIECADKVEGDSDSRPVEEDVLMPPFGRSFKDDEEFSAYDGEDAWQDVSEFNKLRHIYYEDVDPDEENRGYVEDLENIPTEKGEGGSYFKTRWNEDKNRDSGKEKKAEDEDKDK